MYETYGGFMASGKLIRGLMLLVTGCLAFSYAAQAETYYVAKSGSDSNTGLSLKQAWLTIGHAALVAQAGSTVHVGAGIYHESVNFGNSGTASAPIVFNGGRRHRGWQHRRPLLQHTELCQQ